MFVEVSDLQPWVILSLNAGALKTTGERMPHSAPLVLHNAALCARSRAYLSYGVSGSWNAHLAVLPLPSGTIMRESTEALYGRRYPSYSS